MNPNDAPDSALCLAIRHRRAAAANAAARLLSRLQHHVAEEILGRGDARKSSTMRVEQPPPHPILHRQTQANSGERSSIISFRSTTARRSAAFRIVEPLDERLYRNRGVGYRYEDMPPDREAFRLGKKRSMPRRAALRRRLSRSSSSPAGTCAEGNSRW